MSLCVIFCLSIILTLSKRIRFFFLPVYIRILQETIFITLTKLSQSKKNVIVAFVFKTTTTELVGV